MTLTHWPALFSPVPETLPFLLLPVLHYNLQQNVKFLDSVENRRWKMGAQRGKVHVKLACEMELPEIGRVVVELVWLPTSILFRYCTFFDYRFEEANEVLNRAQRKKLSIDESRLPNFLLKPLEVQNGWVVDYGGGC